MARIRLGDYQRAMSQFLYIPKRIKIGYQKRQDTYSGKLSYVIYWDDAGKLRKEASWSSWRNKKIAAEEYDNVPTEGFVLHKDIKRYQFSSHFGSKRTMIRVWDPRGIEFEITTENLVGVLMNSDCSKRGLVGQFVYAWAGTELVLLPCCSEEYQSAIAYTALQSGKVGIKDLVPGCGYKTKKQVDLVYVGRFHWHELKGYRIGQRETKRYHIFHRLGRKDDYEDKHVWELKSNLDFLAARTTEEPVAEYASIIEAFQKNIHSVKIVKWEVEPVEVSIKLDKHDYYTPLLQRSTYHTLKDGIITEYSVCAEHDSKHENGSYVHTLKGYTVDAKHRFDISAETLSEVESQRPSYEWNYYDKPKPTYLNADQLQQQGLGNLFVTLDNGRRVRLEYLHHL